MANKNNSGLPLQSMRSKSWFRHNDSIEGIVVSSGNSKLDWTTQRILISAMDMINHILIVLVTLYVVYHAAKEYSATNVHVILCTIGYVLLMSEATIVLASDNMLTASLSRRANKHLHWILQAVGLIMNLVGVGVMYNTKSIHFFSIHGLTGISSLVITCLVTISGYPVWIAWKLRKFVRPMITKFLHNLLAITGFIIGMVSQCYGYEKTWVRHITKIKHANDMLLVFTILITVLSLRSALTSLYRQVANYLKLICTST